MRRRLLAPLLAVAVGLTGAACGGDSAASPLEIVRASSAKTTAADSAKVSIAIDTTLGAEKSRFTGEGAFDFAARTGMLTLDLGSLLAGTTLEARLIGDLAYVGVPPVAAGLLGGKKFLRIDLAALGAQNAAFQGLAGSTDPTSGVVALRGAKDVTKVGAEDVRGEATTHYRGTLDLGVAKAEASGDAAASIDELKTLLSSEEVPFDVWIDGDGRVRRTSMSVDLAASAQTQNKPVQTKVVTELYDFGTEVSVTAPPDAEVADGNSFLAGIAGGIGG